MKSSAELTSVMKHVIEEMVSGKDIAVAFSGGLDSGIVAAVAKEYANSVRLYTAGVENAYDVVASEELSRTLGIEWEHISISDADLEQNVREMISVTGTVNPITLSFEIPLFYVSKSARERYIIGGQGADELFAGYSKYIGLSENDLKDRMEADMVNLLNVTLVHERAVSEHFSKTIFYPYLDRRVMDVVGRIDMKDMIPGEIRKENLRKVAEAIGQPEVAEKKKKAAQYGSGAMNLLRKISKQKGLTVNELITELCNECDRERSEQG